MPKHSTPEKRFLVDEPDTICSIEPHSTDVVIEITAKDYRNELGVRKISEIVKFADGLADHARSIVLAFNNDNLGAVLKESGGGPVSALDYKTERKWRSLIKHRFPGHGIVGEEYGTFRGCDDFVWLLDPIDGTDDLARGSPLFGTIISVLYRGAPIVGIVDHPKLNWRFRAAYGFGADFNGKTLNLDNLVRRDLGEAVVVPAHADLKHLHNHEKISNAINNSFPNQRVYRNVYGHTMVASGNFDACLEVNVSAWDIAASQLLIEEANGKFVDLESIGIHNCDGRISAVFGRAETVNRFLSIIQASNTAT